MGLFEKLFDIRPSIVEITEREEAYREKYKGHILEQEEYSPNSIGISLHTDTKECVDWLLKHINNSKEGIKLTVEPIKDNSTYITITLEGKEIDHIKCKDFQFIYDDYQGYLRFTTETIPSDLFRCYRKHGNETLFDIVAYGVQHGSQIRIDVKGSKLISGVNIDSNKPIELYFQVSDDYILDIT